MRFHSAGRTDTGRSRKHNEDCFEIDAERNLYVVADGMGGHCHGEVASQITIETISGFIGGRTGFPSVDRGDGQSALGGPANDLRNAIRTAHERVLEAIDQDQKLHGMGTTVVGLYFQNGVGALAHVGDSRAYRLRGNELEQLTEDHTWVNEQVLAGALTDEQAKNHPLKNVVTRALGSEREVLVDLREVESVDGDRYLVCSDGLTTMLTDEEIGEVLVGQPDADDAASTLIDEANLRGGYDNITVIIVDIGGARQHEEAPALPPESS